jgi:hypothetical protein
MGLRPVTKEWENMTGHDCLIDLPFDVAVQIVLRQPLPRLPVYSMSKDQGRRLRPFVYLWDDPVGQATEKAIAHLKGQLGQR